MIYLVRDNAYIETPIEADSPLLAAAEYIRRYLPQSEEFGLTGICTASRAIVKTTEHMIDVRQSKSTHSHPRTS